MALLQLFTNIAVISHFLLYQNECTKVVKSDVPQEALKYLDTIEAKAIYINAICIN